MESAVQLRPRYVVFDLSPGAGLRCFGPPAPAAERAGVTLRTVALGLEALRRTRLSRADDDPAAAHRPAQKVLAGDDHVHVSSDPDTVSDAGTSGVHQATEESDDDEEEAGSFDDELFSEEGFARKVGALAELVGMNGAYEPEAVLGEVVRLLQATGSVRARMAV